MRCLLLGIFCLISYQTPTLADEIPSTDNTTGSPQWHSEQQGLSLTLVQLGSEYVSAVFAARGLPKDVVDDISTYCLFGTIIKNTSTKSLSAQLSDWRIVTREGKEHRLKLKEDWVKQWRAKGVGFRWLLLSDQQNFDDGDWIQGFTTVALPPGQRFDLYYSWKQQDKLFNNTIKGMSCAPVSQQTP